MGTRPGLGAENDDGTFLDYGLWPGPKHVNLADAFEALKGVVASMGESFAGSAGSWGFRPRPKSDHSPSTHAYGLAVDLNAPSKVRGSTPAKVVVNEATAEKIMAYGISMTDAAQVLEVYAQSFQPFTVAETTPPPPKVPKHVGPRPKRQFDRRGRRRF